MAVDLLNDRLSTRTTFHVHLDFLLHGSRRDLRAWVAQMHMRREQGETIPPVLPGDPYVTCHDIMEGQRSTNDTAPSEALALIRYALVLELVTPGPVQPPGGWATWTLMMDRLRDHQQRAERDIGGWDGPTFEFLCVVEADTGQATEGNMVSRQMQSYHRTSPDIGPRFLNVKTGIEDVGWKGPDITDELRICDT